MHGSGEFLERLKLATELQDVKFRRRDTNAFDLGPEFVSREIGGLTTWLRMFSNRVAIIQLAMCWSCLI